ncbi:alpha/beta hydrolase [Arthrobacter gandavensis]|uniref:alpha/beta fold hydrolase n=1 Tax=Arthrobacter gandavensis TaxID=169960 RepID=UPI00188E0F86|nr:alpha/beta hydrolase [Arthrobacter gandavensis]MBF4993976.1 alpha/beta hydrolase [Arthrobacter gandavensis]
MSATAARPEVRRLRAGDTEVGIRSSGTPGPDVVLVHGIGASSRYFEPLARELSHDHNVHLVELPGHAGMERPREALTMAGYGASVAGALRQAGIDDALLAGHSMGCQVVVEAALADPQLVASLLLLAPTVNRAERKIAAQAFRLAQDTLHETFAVNRIVFSDYLRTGPRWYLGTLRRMMDHRMEKRLALTDCPAAVISGSRDPIVPRSWLLRLEEARDGVVLGEVPAAPHVLMWNSPEPTAEWVRRLRKAVQ